MLQLPDALRDAPSADRTSHRPELLHPAVPGDRQRLEALLSGPARPRVYDTLALQLMELVRTLHPSRRFTAQELEEAAKAHLQGTDPTHYGVWVYYPWDHRLVHVLPEQEFALVRTDRNRNKITREEQALLATKRVGVIGLSVGQSVALTMAMERSFGEIRLADFDTLELSNLNRIRSGVHEMGVPKVINTAREIAELDPFLRVTVFAEGITRDNIDAFLSEGGRLDVLIEECDSVDVKIFARQRAKAMGIAVVMDTSDRGMHDIERFDLEPDRPVLHGLVDHLDLDAAARARTNEEKLPFILPMAGVDGLSPRMKASMLEIGQAVHTWPQLGSSVVLGGSIGADTYRRIALGEALPSGRWYLEPHVPVADPAPASTSENQPSDASPTLTMERMVELVSTGGTEHKGPPLEHSIALALCEAGSKAPSAGNMQPWRFLLQGGAIHVFNGTTGPSVLDDGGLIGSIDMACCLENMLLKASELGVPLELVPYPAGLNEPYIAYLHAAESMAPATPDHLAKAIDARCTNRHLYDGRLLSAEVIDDLRRSVSAVEGCELHLLGARDLAEVADIVGEAERLRLLNPSGHAHLFGKEIRWTPEEARRTMDGLDLDTFELRASDRAGLRVASDAKAIEWLRSWKGGHGFRDLSGNGIRTSSAVALVSVTSNDPRAMLGGGRAVQRLWLSATANGLASHPIGAPILMAHHVRHGKGTGLSSEEASAILRIYDRLSKLAGLNGREAVFMFRLGHAPPPTAVALRKPLEDLVLFNEQPIAHTWNS